MNTGAQAAKGIRDFVRCVKREAMGGRELKGSAAGRPPVLVHSVDEHAVEIEHQQGAGNQRGEDEKLGR